jgi:uncharacterized membrane protein
MASILRSLGRTLIAGVVLLALVLALAAWHSGHPLRPSAVWAAFLLRWLHVLSGVMWLGLLYYFNFVQIPSMPRLADEHKPAVTKVIAPAALFWFRWAALATVVTGLLVALVQGYLVPALTLAPGVYGIGVGMWLGLIMAFNVWFLLWPNQKKALGLVEATAEEKATAARRAMLVSRFNLALSIPMLYAMVGQSHGGF